MSSRLGQKNQSQAFSRPTDNVETRKKTKSGIHSTDRKRRDSDKKNKVRHSFDRPTTSRLGKKPKSGIVDHRPTTSRLGPTTSRLGQTSQSQALSRPTDNVETRIKKSQASSVTTLDATSAPQGPLGPVRATH